MPPRSTWGCMMCRYKARLLMSNRLMSSGLDRSAGRCVLCARSWQSFCPSKSANQHITPINNVCSFHEVAHQDSMSLVLLTVAAMTMTMHRAPPHFRCTASSQSVWQTKLMMSSNLMKLWRLLATILSSPATAKRQHRT